MSVLALKGVEKSYRLGRTLRVPALRGLDLEIDAGEFVAIVGPSGSGKTTLLNLAGLLDRPDTGEILIGGTATSSLSETERARMRRDRIGFIFQTFNLLPHLTAEENVALPLRYGDGRSKHTPAELLARMGLSERLAHKPDELSGGEQQRVAIARSLMLDPALILADEPTGDLDSETAAGIVAVLEDLRAEGKTLVVVTHNEELARTAQRRVHVRDGLIEDDTAKVAAKPRPRAKPKAKAEIPAPRKAATRKAPARKAPTRKAPVRKSK